jgi:hypothetical protein
MAMTFLACKQKVKNRGRPPVAFLTELVEWARTAPDSMFERNGVYDVYSSVAQQLGPWTDLKHRKAAMLEVLRVLGGFESSWDWLEGRDMNNPTSNKPCTEEAGMFQCSGNSMEIDASLAACAKERGITDCPSFIARTKADHRFAIDYCARLLRCTVTHHGPVKRKEINAWLRREAVQEFAALL